MFVLFTTLTLVLAAEPAAADETFPTATEIRAAVEKSLPFLLEGGELWRDGKAGGGQNGRVCSSCHQIPFSIWSHNEALVHGFKIEQARLDDLTTWTLDWCAEQKRPNTQTHTGGFLSTMQQLIMGRSAAPPNESALKTYELFERVLGEMQKEEGFWKEGNQIVKNGADREANEVDTMWIILGLSSLEKIEGLPKESRDSAAKNRQEALAWLKAGQPGTRADWFLLRMLVEREFGAAEKAKEYEQNLLDLQNADGGWPLLKGESSHALVTGQTLYALNIVGRTPDDPIIRRATRHLLHTQQPNGSWKAGSRREAANVNVVTIHWGTAWAAMGLMRSLPK